MSALRAASRRRLLPTLVALLLGAAAEAAQAAADPADLCLSAARIAATESGVPLAVLVAITGVETGRGSGARPWPWTVNMEGEGRWFDDGEQARAFVEAAMRRGARSFDIGCFQINHRWHGTAFASIEAMFDPLENARYAARFLGDLRAETGDWSRAAGAYHSRTPDLAQRYRARFDRLHAALSSQPEAGDPVVLVAEAAPPRLPRVNGFVLLQSGTGAGSLGSLVPVPRKTSAAAGN